MNPKTLSKEGTQYALLKRHVYNHKHLSRDR